MEFFPFIEFNAIVKKKVSVVISLRKNTLFQFPISTDSYFLTKLLMDIALEYSFFPSRALFRLQFFSAWCGELFQTPGILRTEDWVSVMFTPCLWNMDQHSYVSKEGSFFSETPRFLCIYVNSSIQSTYKPVIIGNICNANSYNIIFESMEHK